MSHVTAVLVMVDLTGDDDVRLLDALNAFDGAALKDLTQTMCGPKHPQALVFGFGANYFDIPGFLAFLRAFPWADYEAEWAQVALQDEHDEGFGFVEVFRAPNASPAWSEH